MTTRYPQAILVSCEIPWDENEELLEGCFRQEIRATLQHFNHLYIFGTAGEGYAVTLSQFQRIVRIFHEETDRDDVFPMVGVIAMSTTQIVERIGFAHELGFRAFQIALPSWGAVNDDEYLTFFKDVCGTFPDAKFIHYNLPRAKRVLLGPDYQRLVEAVPNLAGTKNCRTDINDILGIATYSPELQHFYGEHGFPHGCLFGECSLLSSFGAMFPSKTKEFFHYGVTRQWDKLFPMQAEYLQVANAFLAPARGLERIDGAYDKMIVRASGVDMPLRLLSPYEGFDLETFNACVRAVRERYPDWLG
ncbi:MAG: dihydrodipicolinate synthase family protein [Candidatus Poribacteria bacterium]|nr:dihydrodipicolinate synthase family protein [Candidatus Poribacteria bacterium]